MELEEKQYELDGVAFGLGCPVEVKDGGWTPGQAALRTADADRPSGDGVRMGKDRRGAATWGFEMFTNAETEEDAWAAVSALADVWDDEDVRTVSDEVVALRYRIAGQTRRVYGRPRRWTTTPNNLSLGGRIDIVADFGTVDDLIYEDAEQSSGAITVAAPIDRSAGLLVPFIPPVVLGQRAGVRTSQIVVGGKRPAPVWLTFDGPLAGANVTFVSKPAVNGTKFAADGSLAFAGWTAALVDPVSSDDPVTLDARPWVRSATKRSGGSVRVNPRITRLSKMLLPPGTHNVVFTGVDPSGTASVTIRWRNVVKSPR